MCIKRKVWAHNPHIKKWMEPLPAFVGWTSTIVKFFVEVRYIIGTSSGLVKYSFEIFK